MAKEQSYWTRKLDGCAEDSRLLWRCLNDILMREKEPRSSHTSLTAQALSTFFHDKIAKVRAATQSCLPATFTDPCWSHLNEFHHCTLKEILHVILQSPRKFCTLDPIPHSLLITSLDHIMPLVTVKCNKSLHDGVILECEKQATITSILKKPDLDPDCLSNYWPISNLTFLSKLIKRLVCTINNLS